VTGDIFSQVTPLALPVLHNCLLATTTAYILCQCMNTESGESCTVASILSNIWPSWSIGTHLGGIGHFLLSHAVYAHTSAFAGKRTGSMALPAVFLVQIVCFAGRKYNVCWQDGTPQQRNYSQMQMLSLGTGALALIVRFFTVSIIRTQLFTVKFQKSQKWYLPKRQIF
jgi:hypothetical protein